MELRVRHQDLPGTLSLPPSKLWKAAETAWAAGVGRAHAGLDILPEPLEDVVRRRREALDLAPRDGQLRVQVQGRLLDLKKARRAGKR